MAGRAARRATLAARPAQAVPFSSVRFFTTPRSPHSMRTARTFAVLSFADHHEIALRGDQVDDDCVRGAHVRAEPPSVLAADQDLFGRWQDVAT